MDDVDGKSIPNVEDKSQEEIIIDEILSMPIETLIQVKKVPDRLLSPISERLPARRMSLNPNLRRMSTIPCSRRGSTFDTSQDPQISA